MAERPVLQTRRWFLHDGVMDVASPEAGFTWWSNEFYTVERPVLHGGVMDFTCPEMNFTWGRIGVNGLVYTGLEGGW